uniref:Uncharacterized protein n=1 Tax=Nelumbo nucifera TaxID=4432 RepID=A0A822YJ80_NELNU|nr:TPA_asm: hypothetical protein HUJ06_011428 [Nelumbo nucifera]
MGEHQLMESVRSIVLKESETLEGACQQIRGYDFSRGLDYAELLKSMVSTGFQASNLGDAIEVVNQMVTFGFIALEIAFCFHFIFGLSLYF